MTADSVQLRNLTRRLSRLTYLALYFVVGLQQIAGRGVELRRDGPVMLGTGLITLIAIRVLALALGLRKSQQAPQQQPQHQYTE
jgi:hypothetical protein